MLVAWIILGVSVLTVTIILIRRFPQAAMLDVETIAAEQQKRAKERLALARIKRSAEAFGNRMKVAFSPLEKAVKNGAKSVYDRVLTLEKKYQEERRSITKPMKEEEREKVSQLVAEGMELIETGRHGEAEQVFIKVVSRDARNVAAYKGLARIYIETLQFDQAKETVDFLLKLKPGDAESFAMRSEIAYAKGDLRVAEEEMVKASDASPENMNYVVDLAQILFEGKKYTAAAAKIRLALERDQNNPKYLDFLVDASILGSDVKGAEAALERLKAVNPENKKIEEFERKIAGMRVAVVS